MNRGICRAALIWHLLVLALTCDGVRVRDDEVADKAGHVVAPDHQEMQNGSACQRVVAKQGEPDDVHDMMVRHDLVEEKVMLDTYLTKSQSLWGTWKSININKELSEGGHEERFSKKGVDIYLVRKKADSPSGSGKYICFVEPDIKGYGWQPPGTVYSDGYTPEHGGADLIPHRMEMVKLPNKWMQDSLDLSSSLKSLPTNVRRMLRERGAEDVHDRLMASIKEAKSVSHSELTWLRNQVRQLKPSFNRLKLDVQVCEVPYMACVKQMTGSCDFQMVKDRFVKYVDLTKMKRGYPMHGCS